MGRLIDEDELKAVIDGYDYSEEGYAERIDFEFLYEVIDKQPTVYDPEVVAELLEGASYFAECLDAKTRYINLYKAIEIVRNGGVK